MQHHLIWNFRSKVVFMTQGQRVALSAAQRTELWSRCTRLGAPSASRITPFTVFYRSTVGLFPQPVGARCWYSLQLSERTFLAGSLLVRRCVILRKVWSALRRR